MGLTAGDKQTVYKFELLFEKSVESETPTVLRLPHRAIPTISVSGYWAAKKLARWSAKFHRSATPTTRRQWPSSATLLQSANSPKKHPVRRLRRICFNIPVCRTNTIIYKSNGSCRDQSAVLPPTICSPGLLHRHRPPAFPCFRRNTFQLGTVAPYGTSRTTRINTLPRNVNWMTARLHGLNGLYSAREPQ